MNFVAFSSDPFEIDCVKKALKLIFDEKSCRKTLPTWTEQVKVSSDNGLEGPSDDGYSWRKYGQKHILGAKYPRYYIGSISYPA